MLADYKHRPHFRRIASKYHDLRTTDIEPVLYIKRQLKSLDIIEAVDIGCGTGRYTELLNQYLRDKLSFLCGVDYSIKMLEQFKLHLSKSGSQVAGGIKASAMCLPFTEKSLNCIFSFNAVHHFALLEFLRETERVLQPGGYLFIYTRLRSQNSRNIWGRFFPSFASKENRLYELDELGKVIGKIPSLRLQEVRTFKFTRKSDLERLCEQARHHHYSTFDLYSHDEFKLAFNQFRKNLLNYFDDSGDIQWNDENTLLVFRTAG